MISSNKQERFLECLESVYESLERFALSMTLNREEARELVCETVAAAYERFDSVQHKEAFLSYVFTIASRTFYRRLGQRKRYDVMSAQDIDALYAGGVHPDDATDITLLYESIDKLPPDYKEVLVMAEIVGLTHKEIQEATGMSIANIKVRVFRAKKKLKELLGVQEETEEEEAVNTIENSLNQG